MIESKVPKHMTIVYWTLTDFICEDVLNMFSSCRFSPQVSAWRTPVTPTNTTASTPNPQKPLTPTNLKPHKAQNLISLLMPIDLTPTPYTPNPYNIVVCFFVFDYPFITPIYIYVWFPFSFPLSLNPKP